MYRNYDNKGSGWVTDRVTATVFKARFGAK